MKTAKLILCVIPGYNAVNPPEEEVIAMASGVFSKVPEFAGRQLQTVQICYPRSLGAPEGGETGITMDLPADDPEKLRKAVVKASVELGQIDAGILLYENGKFEAYYFIHNEFAQGSCIASEVKEISSGEAVHMRGRLGEDDLVQVSLRLQKLLETKDEADYDLAVRLEKTDHGIEWIAVQNPFQGQTDPECFTRSVNNVFRRFAETE